MIDPLKIREIEEKAMETVLRKAARVPPEELEAFAAAVDAAEACGNLPTPQALGKVAKAALCKHLFVAEKALELLSKWLNCSDVARQTWLDVSRSKYAKTRWLVVAFSKDELVPRPLAVAVIRERLGDKSIKVREAAVDAAGIRTLVEVLDELKVLEAAETSINVREALGYVLPVLQDGFHVSDYGDDDPNPREPKEVRVKIKDPKGLPATATVYLTDYEIASMTTDELRALAEAEDRMTLGQIIERTIGELPSELSELIKTFEDEERE